MKTISKKLVLIGIAVVMSGVSFGQDMIPQKIDIDITTIKGESENLLNDKVSRIKEEVNKIKELPLVNAADSTQRQASIENVNREIERLKTDINDFYRKTNDAIETGKNSYNKQLDEIQKSLNDLENKNTAVKIVVDKINEATKLSEEIGELNNKVTDKDKKINNLTIENNAYKRSLEAIKDTTKFGPFGIGLALGMNIDLFNQTSYYTDRDSLAKSDSYWAIGSGMISAIVYYKFAKRWRVVLNFPLATFLGKDAKSFFNEKVNFGAGLAWDITKETEKGLSLFLIINFNTHKQLKINKYEDYKFPYPYLTTIDIEKYDTRNIFTPSVYIGVCYPF
ncbi:hypothetical protein FACS189413_10660 [Bacteroidia bacterium]|nr:hypothetical protein FACS189413_10660 [Bacteroidia bacterium]